MFDESARQGAEMKRDAEIRKSISNASKDGMGLDVIIDLLVRIARG